MKLILVALLFSNLALARHHELLKCLGAEEKTFHQKKDLGPLYDLNQKLISEIILIPNVSVSPDALKLVCDSRGSESWKLLQLSLERGKALFEIPPSIKGMQRQMTEGMIDDYLQATREILVNLISQIQAQSPSADCLTKEFPKLVNFFQDLKYLQEEVDIEQLFKGRDVKIFEDLKNYPQAIKRCQQRLKKKLKSESTSKDKKS
jgi:hypothetical protein